MFVIRPESVVDKEIVYGGSARPTGTLFIEAPASSDQESALESRPIEVGVVYHVHAAEGRFHLRFSRSSEPDYLVPANCAGIHLKASRLTSGIPITKTKHHENKLAWIGLRRALSS